MNALPEYIKSFPDLSLPEQELVLGWRNHPDIARNMIHSQPIPLEDHLKFVEKLKSDEINRYFLICDAGRPLGVVYLNRIQNNQSEAGYYLKPGEQGQGRGKLLHQALLYVARELLQLHVLRLHVFEWNHGACRFYLKMGFCLEPENNRQIEKNGQIENLLGMKLDLLNPQV